MAIQGHGRSVDLDELKGKALPGLYVLNVPKAVKSYYKIGISEADIETRVSQYILSYPWGFHIVAVLLYPEDYTRYYKVREAESEVLKHFKDKRVFRFPKMRSSEWIKLKSKKETNALKTLLENIGQRDNAKLTWFADTHEIKLVGAGWCTTQDNAKIYGEGGIQIYVLPNPLAVDIE